MKKYLLIILLTFNSLYLLGQNTMLVHDPTDPWNSGTSAVIENIIVDIEDEGNYAIIDITYDLSAAQPQFFHDAAALEFVTTFNLNENAFFCDSWLWIDNYISEGEIYERDEGTEIYESLVERTTDPSILTKLNNNQYSLKVYPLMPDSIRRVKLSYMQAFSEDDIRKYATIPVYDWFSESWNNIENIEINFTLNESIGRPGIHTQFANITEYETSTSNTFKYMIESTNINKNIEVFYPRDNNEIVAGSYHSETEQFFQWHIQPDFDIDISDKYYLFVLDASLENIHSNLTTLNSFYNEMKGMVAQAIYEEANINAMYYNENGEAILVYDNWVNATKSNLDHLFHVAASNQSTENNIEPLLIAALDHINDQNNEIEIIFQSTDNSLASAEASEDLFYDIQDDILDKNFHIIDYASYGSNFYVTIDNNTFWMRGNDYFYQLVNGVSNGLYLESPYYYYMETSLTQDFFNDLLINLDYFTNDYMILTEFEDGFAYSEFHSNANNRKLLNFNKPINCIGKYFGNGDIHITINALINNELYSSFHTITEENISELSESTQQAWAGNYILDNENTSNYIEESMVIQTSKDNDVLSKLTVFLCLEQDPDSVIANAPTVYDEYTEDWGIINNTTNIENGSFNLKAYPSPFTDHVNVEVEIPSFLNTENLEISLLNINGNEVKVDAQISNIEQGKYEIQLNNLDHLAKGVYFLQLKSNAFIKTVKLMKL